MTTSSRCDWSRGHSCLRSLLLVLAQPPSGRTGPPTIPTGAVSWSGRKNLEISPRPCIIRANWAASPPTPDPYPGFWAFENRCRIAVRASRPSVVSGNNVMKVWTTHPRCISPTAFLLLSHSISSQTWAKSGTHLADRAGQNIP